MIKTVTYYVVEVFDDSMICRSAEHVPDLRATGTVGARLLRSPGCCFTRRSGSFSPRPRSGFCGRLSRDGGRGSGWGLMNRGGNVRRNAGFLSVWTGRMAGARPRRRGILSPG